MQENLKSSQQTIKNNHLKLVFNLIHKYGPISRIDLKKKTGLSATTVSSLVEELIDKDFVAEVGMKSSSTSGRKAILLKTKSDGGYFVGIDVGSGMVTADTYSLELSSVFHMDIPSSAESLALNIMHAISMATRGRNILGITIGLPGVVDTEKNIVISSTVIDPDTIKDIYSTVRQAMPDTELLLKNNSGLVAYAEKEFGGHGNINNLISIDIDDGVGAGIFLDGSIYSGANGMAGEFGHTTIDYKGNRCKCGNYGCLELVASVPAILKASNCSSLDEVCQKLNSKDKAACDTIDNVANALAFAINNLNNIIDPHLIVICGHIKVLGDFLLLPLQKYLQDIALMKNKEVKYSKMHQNAVTLGGAKVSFDRIFGM